MKRCFTPGLVALMFYAGLACSPESEQVGETNQTIVGGYPVKGFSALGALIYDQAVYCTGTLIGPRHVLTAAHCIDGFPLSNIKFLIGADINQPEYLLDIEGQVIHPKYQSDGWYGNDIGVLILKNDAPVQPMKILTEMDTSWEGETLFFAGFGDTNGYQHTGSGQKRGVWMKISSVSATTFEYFAVSKNTCSGDSGGPAFYKDPRGNYYIAGITSTGDYYCLIGGTDTRVDTYLDFFKEYNIPFNMDYCQEENTTPKCEGQTRVWCEGKELKKDNCAVQNQTCVFDISTQQAICKKINRNSLQCQRETWEGRCKDDILIWCDVGQVKSKDCSESKKKCQLDVRTGSYGCI